MTWVDSENLRTAEYCLLPSGEKQPRATIASGFSQTKCNHRGRSMFWCRLALLEGNIKPYFQFTHLCEWKKMGIRHKARSQMSRDRQRVPNEKTSRHSLVDKDVCLSSNHLLSFVDTRQKWSLSPAIASLCSLRDVVGHCCRFKSNANANGRPGVMRYASPILIGLKWTL